MKAARSEARRLVGEALAKRDSALAELSAVKGELADAKGELADAKSTHERECAEIKLRCAELAAAAEAAAENAAASKEIESLKRIHAETLESLDCERGKAQSLLERLGEVSNQLEGERLEKEEFRQEVLGLRTRLENTSGLSNDEVNSLVTRAQVAEERSSELSQNMTTLQNQAKDYERQLKEAKDNYERLMRVSGEELKKRKSELEEIYGLHEGELESNRELMKDNAALTDSIAKVKAELETVSVERDELRGKLDGSSRRIEELEASLVAERESACRLRDNERETAGKIGDLAHEKETLAEELAAAQKAHADAVAALKAAQANNETINADLQAAREESYRQRHDHEQTIEELQAALDSKQGEVERATQEAHRDELESLQKAVESERERADRAEGMARAAELLREDLETFKGKVGALRQQLSVCSNLKDDLADAESKLMEATAKAADAESRARAAERDSSRLSKELERVNLKLAEESSRADGASAALQEADGVKSLALPHGLLPGETTTVAFGSGFQKFVVKKLIYKDDGSILAENGQGQSVPMGAWR
ncbi:hypothetical protein DW029_02955 [Collinsella sp. AF38-3AC]|nr:hypothetical protein DW029_02955 [Collinsella sp. AF38-3AC]